MVGEHTCVRCGASARAWRLVLEDGSNVECQGCAVAQNRANQRELARMVLSSQRRIARNTFLSYATLLLAACNGITLWLVLNG